MISAVMSGVAVADTAKLEVLVLDDVTGQPIEGALVRGGFEVEVPSWERVKGNPRPNEDIKLTDKQGGCKLQGKTNCGEAGVAVRSAAGYYRPMHGVGRSFKAKNFFGVWQPDNLVVTIKLQRVEHPIPLWVKKELLNVKQEIANINQGRFSYDMMMGEWLPPFGKGKVADIEFTRLPHEDLGEGVSDGIKSNSYRDAVAVKFVGVDNGIFECWPPAESCLKIRSAPEDGYTPDYLCWEGRDRNLKYSTNYDKKRCLAFRIRTQKDEKGQIKKSYYGKIYNDIVAYTGSNHAIFGVMFSYYLNPTSLDRNLEWDRKTNLCPNPGDVGHSVGDRLP